MLTRIVAPSALNRGSAWRVNRGVQVSVGPWSQFQGSIHWNKIGRSGSFDVQTNMGGPFDSDGTWLLHARLRRPQSSTWTAPGRQVGLCASTDLPVGEEEGPHEEWQRLGP
ncbi:uncharacterized protein BO80DRAFT_283086 [Aspergillus ibericus CBS 121593]|uniref:Uncharacterized protein n=1 Tax=Aspergillus ibericus CBS 121593 TaxID=1448316 RepID=A0A395HB45_9EURO|nr:hypothetical protein BO80DRAFT_283086 [Aspergillus ibericus CBS 121593]RAL03424.1 hypothetical protein BO80DRAFT_283086 [Aspergillus ibericus CBS 121593]